MATRDNRKLERNFQRSVIKEIEKKFVGAMVFKMEQIQGIPDLLVLYKDKWATLEVKRAKNAHRQPNQEYYVNKMNSMSFSRFIFPENRKQIIEELKKHFGD